MESIQSKLTKIILRIMSSKKICQLTGEELKKSIEKKQSIENPEPPRKMKNKYYINKSKLNGRDYYVIEPLRDVGNKHVFFLYGGGYVSDIRNHYWEFLAWLCDSLKCKITVPIYPLAPKYNYKDVFDMIVPLYIKIASGINLEDLIIMGDSSGGGMSLALAEILKEKEIPQPGNIVLISPALDWTFTNSEIYKFEKSDPVLAVPALLDMVKWYSGEQNSKHYLISPIYGDFEGVGKISLFIGTNDIFYPDAIRFKKLAEKKGMKINFFEYPSMIHNWPLYSFPESKKARGEIIQIIK